MPTPSQNGSAHNAGQLPHALTDSTSIKTTHEQLRELEVLAQCAGLTSAAALIREMFLKTNSLESKNA